MRKRKKRLPHCLTVEGLLERFEPGRKIDLLEWARSLANTRGPMAPDPPDHPSLQVDGWGNPLPPL
jgi:hypothetical protein